GVLTAERRKVEVLADRDAPPWRRARHEEASIADLVAILEAGNVVMLEIARAQDAIPAEDEGNVAPERRAELVHAGHHGDAASRGGFAEASLDVGAVLLGHADDLLRQHDDGRAARRQRVDRADVAIDDPERLIPVADARRADVDVRRGEPDADRGAG